MGTAGVCEAWMQQPGATGAGGGLRSANTSFGGHVHSNAYLERLRISIYKLAQHRKPQS